MPGQKIFGIFLAAVALVAMSAYLMAPAGKFDSVLGGGGDNSTIIVTKDSYGFPLRCSIYTRSLQITLGAGAVQYSPKERVEVIETPTVTVVRLSGKSPEMASAPLIDILGFDAEACARIQERQYDPDMDEFVGPGDDYGHSRPEEDRE
jgi:hypothetical protein